MTLTDLIPQIHRHLLEAVPEDWPGLRHLANRLLATPRPESLLPLAACVAAGGSAADATPVAAAIIATEISVLILDDAYDQDRPHALWRSVGTMRACNFASAFQSLGFAVLARAALPDETRQRILRVLCDAYLEIASGQDLDLAQPPRDLEAYWALAERKTGGGYAAALEAGGRVATDDRSVLHALRRFGYHTGLAVQVFNDLRGTWFAHGVCDLEQGKVTLPLVYALGCDHADRGLLEGIVKDGQIARHRHTVLQILDRIDARAFLVWAALQHRDKALAALAPIAAGPGRIFLEDFITGAFGNIDVLMKGAGGVNTGHAHDVIGRDGPAAMTADFIETPAFRSAALSVRQSLRAEPLR